MKSKLFPPQGSPSRSQRSAWRRVKDVFEALAGDALVGPVLMGTVLMGALGTEEAFAKPAGEGIPAMAKLLEAPFAAGEEAVYDIRYGILAAGQVALKVDDGARADEWHFSGRARSSKLLRVFYRVDDSFDSFARRSDMRPRRLEIKVDESNEKGTRSVVYEHGNGIARYRRNRLEHKRGPEVLERDDELWPEALDVFTGLYALRRLDLEPGRQLTLPVHDNGKNWLARIEVGQPRKIQSGLGKREAIHLRVRVELGGKLKTDRELEVWISNDARRTMLRFSAALRFGHLRGVLRAYLPGEGEAWQGRALDLEGLAE